MGTPQSFGENMNQITIRAMENRDIESALQLWRQSFNRGFSEGFDTAEVITRYLEHNVNFSTVAFEGDVLVGALLCGHDGRRGSIYHTAVYPSHRGLGIGKLMEQRALHELKNAGITTGFLFVNLNNPGSKAFWESIGWRVIEDVRYLYKEF